MDQVIQTKEMTKEVLYAMSKRLKFSIEIFDSENNDQNNYLFISMPYEKRVKSDEYDDFKDDEINEMVVKDSHILDEKLKRQFPNSSYIEGQKASNISTIKLMDMLNKSGEDMKMSIDSLITINKTNVFNLKNKNNSQKNSDTINLKDSQNKLSNNKNPSSASFLSKNIKVTESKKTEKSKFLINIINSDLLLNKNKSSKQLRTASSAEIINNNNENEKIDLIDKNKLISLFIKI